MRDAPYSGWVISTVAGNGAVGLSGDGGPATDAALNNPFDLVFDAAGNLIFTDTFNHCIRRINLANGTIATFAGTGDAVHDGDGGPAATAGVFGARAVVCRPTDGGVYIMERQGSSVRLVDASMGTISTIASTGETGYGGDGGPVAAAIFDRPKEMTLDADENILVVDTENHAIRLVDLQADRVATVTGNGSDGFNGDGIAATEATLGRPHGVAVGPDGAFYIGDTENNRIRKVAPPS